MYIQLKPSVDTTAIIESVNSLTDSAEKRFIDLILSIEMFQTPSSPTSRKSNNIPINIDNSSNYLSPLLSNVTALVNGYLSAIRELLHDFIGSEEKFKRIPGQENKLLLLKFFISDDKYFSEALQPYFDLLNYKCSPNPVLLPGTKFNTSQIQV